MAGAVLLYLGNRTRRRRPAATGRALQTSWAALNTPPLDAVAEFTVDSNGFKAEYGRALGGLMSFVSKGGSNEFHGNAFEFLRNEKLDANFFANNRANRARPIVKQHDFVPYLE